MGSLVHHPVIVSRIAVLLLPLVAGCGAPPAAICDPPCGAGTICDPVSFACLPVGGDDAGAPDLAAPGCSPACGGLTPACNANRKCVGCLDDKGCPPGSYCKVLGPDAATCVPGCKDDQRCGGGKCCTMRCVDVGNDANHCGACGNKCSGVHTQALCVAGKCQMGKCDSGWGDCNKDPKDGCETNLHVDANHCTGCGMKCSIANAVAACADGCYAAACKWGFDDCNNDPMDGCETSVLADGANCGACGKSCAKLPNAAAGCQNGSCVLGMCNPGYVDCDGDPKTGCEANLDGDKNNCGACGKVCPMNLPYCAKATCQNGCLDQGKIPPAACATGKDPFSGDPWVVCKSDCQSVWISHAVMAGGSFHPETICKELGYTTLAKWGGTCGNICGYCQNGTSCMAPGTPNFDNGGKSNDANGVLLRVTVMWQCSR